MKIPILQGTIDRRILVNFRVDPDVLAGVLPAPFQPQIVGGYGMAGICLIRLKAVRPRHWPRWLGFGSENAAHRIAVEWDEGGTVRRGVYIPRRDSASWWNVFAGGRLFPGMHFHSWFRVDESGDRYRVEVSHRDGTHVLVDARRADRLPESSIFQSIEHASEFFRAGSIGYSATRNPGAYDGLELRTSTWTIQPLAVSRIESTFFENRDLFPEGSIHFDCALLMRDVAHEWHRRPTLRPRCPAGVARARL